MEVWQGKVSIFHQMQRGYRNYSTGKLSRKETTLPGNLRSFTQEKNGCQDLECQEKVNTYHEPEFPGLVMEEQHSG